ncbi:hypothetical protein DPMN_190806, partial [Dreissena polymorpha]
QIRQNYCGNRILKAFENSLDPDETPQNVAYDCASGEAFLFLEAAQEEDGENRKEIEADQREYIQNSACNNDTFL